MVMGRWAWCGVALVGCAEALGGLDDGVPRPAPSPVKPAERSTCTAPRWLDGWPRRLPLTVKHAGAPVTDYQLHVALDAHSLGDLRVTTEDGQLLPYWVDWAKSPPELWVRAPRVTEASSLWVYFGSQRAVTTSSMEATFLEGIIDDPSFDRADAWEGFVNGWVSPTSSTNEWSLRLGGGSARLWIVRKGGDLNGATIGLCQSVIFPAGSSYALDFVATIAISERAGTSLLLRDGTEDSAWLWGTQPSMTGVFRATTTTIVPGMRTVCFTAGVGGNVDPQAEDVTYSTLRVRRVVTPEPEVAIAGPVESCP